MKSSLVGMVAISGLPGAAPPALAGFDVNALLKSYSVTELTLIGTVSLFAVLTAIIAGTAGRSEPESRRNYVRPYEHDFSRDH